MSEQENRDAVETAGQEDSSSVDPNADTNQPVEEVLADESSDGTTGDTGENGEGDRTKQLEETIARLEEETSELKNQYLRKQADFENARRRMMRDKEDAVSFANQQLLLDLTSIIDDFERAIKSAEESRDYDAFHNGVVIIEKQLTSMLERKWGLSRFDSEGEPFDPQKHEAVPAGHQPQEHVFSIKRFMGRRHSEVDPREDRPLRGRRRRPTSS
jgi:molecular chaperone GrpE